MFDKYYRNIEYMRVSITNQCNLRCFYCMPYDNEIQRTRKCLTLDEIVYICKCAADIGINKIKITGGEPFVREEAVLLIKKIKEIPKIKQVTLTTNGVLLERYIDELDPSFIDGINVSLDTLKREKYEKITGKDAFFKVWNGINKSLEKGIPTKINVVPLVGINDNELIDIVKLVENKNLSVRFIEIMPIGYGKKYMHIKGNDVLKMIRQKYPDLKICDEKIGNGPATYYSSASWTGNVGFINAVTNKFCSNCNRVRLTSTGYLKTCLCYEDGIDIIKKVREGLDEKEITQIMSDVIRNKPMEHNFYQKNFSNKRVETNEMYKIGG